VAAEVEHPAVEIGEPFTKSVTPLTVTGAENVALRTTCVAEEPPGPD
jgi:hypothetical protein